MKYKYEDWIMHFCLVLVYVIFWLIMLIKVHNPKDFSKKNSYSKSLSVRFYIATTIIMLGLIFLLIKDFIRLYNQ